MASLVQLYKPDASYSGAEVNAIRQRAMEVGNFQTLQSGVTSGRNTGTERGWAPVEKDEWTFLQKFNAQDPKTFNSINKNKGGLLDKVGHVVEYGTTALVIGGIAYGGAQVVSSVAAGGSSALGGGFTPAEIAAGSDAGTLFAPAAVTPTVSTGMTVTQAAMLGSTGLGAAGSLIKPVLEIATAGVGIAGAVSALKGAGMSAANGLPAYVDQMNTPTYAADIVKPGALPAESKNVILLAVGALVLVFLAKKGG